MHYCEYEILFCRRCANLLAFQGFVWRLRYAHRTWIIVHLNEQFICTKCNKIHVILYVFIHDPFLSQSSIKPRPITSLQFSLAGFGDLFHISGQWISCKVRQSDLVLVLLTNSLHQCRHKVGLGVLVVASEDESVPSFRVHCGSAPIPGLRQSGLSILCESETRAFFIILFPAYVPGKHQPGTSGTTISCHSCCSETLMPVLWVESEQPVSVK